MDTKPSSLKDGCLLTLRYFGIFRYPLTVGEIHMFNSCPASLKEVREALDELVLAKEIVHSGQYYLPLENEEWVVLRDKGNSRAYELLDRVGKYVSIIASFPFVRGIAISGSLSKFHASEKTDIDYFIITAANRLWIARSLLHLFKKLTFLTGQQHNYCMNYFVDTRALEISHPNLYTAIETATLLPAYNAPLFQAFHRNNRWIYDYLPNYPDSLLDRYVIKDKPRRFKKLLEGAMGLLFPGAMNRSLMRLTYWKWRRKWRKRGYPEEDYDRAFYTDLHVSKNHPVDYEKKVLNALSGVHEKVSSHS